MNLRIVSFLILLLVILLLRIHFTDGLDKGYVDPTVEHLSLIFEDPRNNLSELANNLLPQPQAALLSGIVLGVKQDLPVDFKKALASTSTLHIVVVSGQNLTLLSGFVLTFSSVLGRKKVTILSLAVVLFYVLLSGLQVPSIRAAIMITFSSLATLLGREGDSWWVLLISALLMLIYNPNWLLSLSFQLSFLATIGVVIIAPELIKKLNFLPEFIKQDFAVTFSAQIMVLPIIASNFHQISAIGILSNLFILWTVPLIMVSGIIVLMVSMINLFIAQFLALLPSVLLTYFIYIVLFFDTHFNSLYINSTNTIIWFGYYFLVLAFWLALKMGLMIK